MKTINSIKLSFSALMLMLAFNSASAQVPTDSIIADFNEFVRLLEETHPDPYTNYGGRPFFRRAAMETRNALFLDSVTSPDELAIRIKSFIAPLQDGHTGIYGQHGQNDEFLAPIVFEAINDGIIIKRVPEEHKNLIGSKLHAIENVPVQEVCDGLAKHYSAENEIGKMMLCLRFMKPNDLRLVIPSVTDEAITYQIETPKGKRVDLRLPLVAADQFREWYQAGKGHNKSSIQVPTKDLTYDFVGKGKNTMYLRLTQIMARDCFEYMKASGMDYQGYLKEVYQAWGKEMPADADEAIAQMPSFSEEFYNMLQLMKLNSSKNLIIDLRGNSGGFTHITIPTLYQMWGDEFIKASDNMEVENYTIISPLLMKKYNQSLDNLNMLNPVKLVYGDYQYPSGKKNQVKEVTAKMRKRIINGWMSSVKDKLKAQNGEAVYTPEHVYVLTDPGTFSAGFHYAFYLWKMGATIVGVSSSQAPNTYMEVTPFELPRTGLKGSFSNTLQLFLPVDDPRAKQFTPDLMPTYEDYKRYNFDDNTILLYLLDYIKGQKN